jgi:hypothetical protein
LRPLAAGSRDRLSVLLLCDNRRSHAPNVCEHIGALQRLSRHRVDVFNPRGLGRSRLLQFNDYDVVVVHYTIFVLSDWYLAPWFREQLADFNGLKVQFIQDEYRQVDAVTARMRELGVDVLFSAISADVIPDIYGSRLPGVDVLPTLTGYVPTELERRPLRPHSERRLDVVYRGRSVPFWLGRLGQDKVLIGREFVARASSTGLRCDIAWTEADRIYGEAWYRFLASSRATLGTESGASIVDFDGSVQERTDGYLAAHPNATFEEVEREILAPFEGNAVIEAVSPRVFEAAALGTAMINFSGRYSDIIEPWTHYVPLEKDFSNFDEVAAAARDEALQERIASRAHADLIASGVYSLRRFVEGFDREIEGRARPLPSSRRPGPMRTVSQKLRSLEQLSAPVQRAELPLIVALRARALEHQGALLIRRFPEIDALARSPHAESGRAGDRLLHDLVRLAAAAAAHLRELRYFGPPFDVRLEFDPRLHTLTLVSTPGPESSQSASQRAQLRDPVASAARAGNLELTWDHRAVGSSLVFPTPVVWTAALEIGYHLVYGAHRFTALEELTRRDPERMIDALEPLFRPRPSVPVHELHGPLGILLRRLSTPGRATVRGTAALRAVLTSKELRRLLYAYLRSEAARAEAPVDLVLQDFLKLSLIAQNRIHAELADGGTTLLYRSDLSEPPGGIVLDPDTVRSLQHIVWDNTAAGGSVTSSAYPRVSVTLDAGRHEFRALTLVTRRFPMLAAPALTRAAEGDA